MFRRQNRIRILRVRRTQQFTSAPYISHRLSVLSHYYRLIRLLLGLGMIKLGSKVGSQSKIVLFNKGYSLALTLSLL